jgi:hypothetical protein
MTDDGCCFTVFQNGSAVPPSRRGTGGTVRCADRAAAVQMIDVHVPTTDGRELLLTRYTQSEPELKLLLEKLKLELPAQPPPKITVARIEGST